MDGFVYTHQRKYKSEMLFFSCCSFKNKFLKFQFGSVSVTGYLGAEIGDNDEVLEDVLGEDVGVSPLTWARRSEIMMNFLRTFLGRM